MAARLTARFDEALLYAARLHAVQRRKGGDVPYVAHLLGVASIVLEFGGDEDQAIAALLHDAVEDQGGAATRAAILQRFGQAVAELVDGCTDSDQTPKPPWRERKDAYLAHLRTAPAGVRLISAADKLYNCLSVIKDFRQQGEALWPRFKGGRDGTLWYYRAVADVLASHGPDPLVAELTRAVGELERLTACEG